MLIIFEGLDKSGKSFYANLLKHKFPGSILIKRMHTEILYPIDYDEGSKYDWQAMYDRIILANPDTMFIADRSFFTHIVYQTCLKAKGTVKPEHIEAYNKYVQVLLNMPHLVIYMKSNRFELDGMITCRQLRDSINDMYLTTFRNIEGMNYLEVDLDKYSASEIMTMILKHIPQ